MFHMSAYFPFLQPNSFPKALIAAAPVSVSILLVFCLIALFSYRRLNEKGDGGGGGGWGSGGGV